MDVDIQWMILRHRKEVLEIEAQSFESPWPEEDFVRCLRQRNCIGMVAEHEQRVAAFMIYELHKRRLHILNFAVHPDFRRKGVGRQMASSLTSKLSQQRRNQILLEVSERNLDAQLFFRAVGFRAISVMSGFYENCNDAAYLMQYRLPTPTKEEGFTPANRISHLTQ